MSLLPAIRKPGDEPLTASEINAIRERLLAGGNSPGRGYDTQGEHVRDYPSSPVDRWPNAWSTVAVEPNSIFALHGGVISPGGYDNTRMSVSPWGFDSPGSPLVWFTNDTLPVLECKWSTVRPINMYSTAWVRWEGEGAPHVGLWCGPKPDTYGVEGGRFGFVVINIKGELVEVMRTFEPIAVVGIIIEKVTAFDPCTKILGRGVLRVEYRNEDSELANAHSVAGDVPDCGSGFAEDSGSDSTAFDVEVWNSSAREFVADPCVRLKAVQVLGVGLVVLAGSEEGSGSATDDCCPSGSSGSSGGSSGGSSAGSGSAECFNPMDLANAPILPAGQLVDYALVVSDGCVYRVAGDPQCGSGSA